MKYAKLLLIVGLVGLVFYGLFVAMGLIKFPPKNEPPVPSVPVAIIDVKDESEPPGKSDDVGKDTFEKYSYRLQSEDLLFSEVREMSYWISKNTHRAEELHGFDNFKEKVDVYLGIIEIVEKPCSLRTFQNILQWLKKNKNKIHSVHLKYLRATYIHSNGSWINAAEESLVNAALRTGGKYISFKEIPSADEILHKYRQSTGSGHPINL